MLKIQNILFMFLFLLTSACQAATPLPNLTPAEGEEFTLAAGQSATVSASTLTVKLVGVTEDGRCPSEVTCAESGPVSIVLIVQAGNEDPMEINLQTFTDYQGRTPEMEFEGIQDRIEYEGYLIRAVSVLPYPVNLEDKIEAGEYRVTFIVTKA